MKMLAWPRLTIEREIGGKKEKFTATRDSENNVYLKGVLRNPIEIDELIVFLKAVLVGGATGEKRESKYEKRFAKYICTCESENKRLIGKGDFPIAVLAGDMFDILKCESCGKFTKRITGVY